MEKTVNITNFIGVYDNYIPKQECNKEIKLYEDKNSDNRRETGFPTKEEHMIDKLENILDDFSILHSVLRKQFDASYLYVL